MTTQNRKTLGLFKIVIRMVLLIFVLGACLQTTRVYAEGETIDLTIMSWGDSLSGIGGSQGHAFLIITNNSSETFDFCGYPIEPGTSISVSIWPDSSGNGGVYINREMYTGASQTCVACTISITPRHLKMIADATPAESYYHDGQEEWDLADDVWHNCTTYSKKMWNMVADNDHQIDEDLAGIDAPKWLKKKLASFPDSFTASFPKRQTESKNVFYLSKEGEFVPYSIPVPKLSVNIEDEAMAAVRLVWYPELIEFPNGQKNINVYGIQFYNTETPDEKGDKDVADSTSLTLSPLEPGYTYGFSVAAAYISSNEEYSIRSDYCDPVEVTIRGDLKEADVSIKKDSYSFTGLPVAPKPTVIYRDRTLKKGRDYTVSYSDNQYVGTATMTVTGIKNFKGKVKKTFKITPVWSLSDKSMTLLQGDSKKISVTVKGYKTTSGARAFIRSIKWKSGKSAVASVSGGRVTAKKKGKTVITASANGQSKTCSVTVKKKDYKSLYKAFLEKGSFTMKSGTNSYSVDLTSYRLLDVNRDKTPELIVKATEPSSGPAFDEHYVFTIRNKKVAFCGSVMKRGDADIYYSKKYKALQNSGWTNFVGGTWQHLFRLKNNKKIVQFKYVWEGYADEANTTYVYYIGDSDAKAKKVSKAKYTAFFKKYFSKKDIKRYKFLANTAKNRRKTFGK